MKIEAPKIMAHKPNYQLAQNLDQRAIRLGKELRKELGFTLKVNLGSLMEIASVLYNRDLSGPDFDASRTKWQNDPVFLRLKVKAARPAVRKLIAEICALPIARVQYSPDDPASQCAAIALNGIEQHLAPATERRILVAGAGVTSETWLKNWPGQGHLTLLDNNPFVAEYLTSCIAVLGERNATVLEGSVFDLSRQTHSFNVIHIGNLLQYLGGPEKEWECIDTLCSLLPHIEADQLVIFQTIRAEKLCEEETAEYKDMFAGLGLTPVNQVSTLTRIGHLYSLFVKPASE